MEDTASPNIKEQVHQFLTQEDQSDFFSLVWFSSYLENTNPGPGNYESVNLMSEKGHYPVSSTWGFGKRVFDK